MWQGASSSLHVVHISGKAVLIPGLALVYQHVYLQEVIKTNGFDDKSDTDIRRVRFMLSYCLSLNKEVCTNSQQHAIAIYFDLAGHGMKNGRVGILNDIAYVLSVNRLGIKPW